MLPVFIFFPFRQDKTPKMGPKISKLYTWQTTVFLRGPNESACISWLGIFQIVILSIQFFNLTLPSIANSNIAIMWQKVFCRVKWTETLKYIGYFWPFGVQGHIGSFSTRFSKSTPATVMILFNQTLINVSCDSPHKRNCEIFNLKNRSKLNSVTNEKQMKKKRELWGCDNNATWYLQYSRAFVVTCCT